MEILKFLGEAAANAIVLDRSTVAKRRGSRHVGFGSDADIIS